MRVLVLDTETTGLVQRGLRNVTMENLSLWPYIVQFSYVITNNDEIEKRVDNIIRLPDGVVMDEQTVAIHKISNDMSRLLGETLDTILENFIEDIKDVNYVVAHNLEYDWNVVKAEYHRLILKNLNTPRARFYWGCVDTMTIMSRNLYCTMKNGIQLCNIQVEGRLTPKWPKLEELHKHLFGVVPKNLHNSLNDVLICLRCFYKMRFNRDICQDNPETALLYEDMGVLPSSSSSSSSNSLLRISNGGEEFLAKLQGFSPLC